MGSIIEEIALNFGVEEKYVGRIFKTSDFYYRKVEIPKKDGTVREVFLPSPEIKAFQHYVIEKYLSKIPTSPFAVGYTKGKSIIDNVCPHIGNKSFLHIDVKDFFDSIDFEVFKGILENYSNIIPNEYVEDILKIITYKRKFVQGCVSSPMVSNIYLFSFDNRISELVQDLDCGIYTRYSDDITISSKKKIDVSYLSLIQEELSQIGLSLNKRKTYFTSDLNSIRITGLNIVGSRLCVGTKYKKDIKNQIFQTLKRNNSQDIDIIIGKLMYLKSIEPNYFNRLNIKYSSNEKLLVDRLFSMK